MELMDVFGIHGTRTQIYYDIMIHDFWGGWYLFEHFNKDYRIYEFIFRCFRMIYTFQIYSSLSGWNILNIFPLILGKFIIPIDEPSYFSEEQATHHQPVMIFIYDSMAGIPPRSGHPKPISALRFTTEDAVDCVRSSCDEKELLYCWVCFRKCVNNAEKMVD